MKEKFFEMKKGLRVEEMKEVKDEVNIDVYKDRDEK